jgi:hypothetical protein
MLILTLPPGLGSPTLLFRVVTQFESSKPLSFLNHVEAQVNISICLQRYLPVCPGKEQQFKLLNKITPGKLALWVDEPTLNHVPTMYYPCVLKRGNTWFTHG